MADDGFNGSTITFGASGAETPLRSIDYKESAAKVQVTGGTSNKGYVAGNVDVSCSFTVVGVWEEAIGATGALAVAWFDGSSESLSGCVVIDKSVSGSEDTEILTTVEVAPTA